MSKSALASNLIRILLAVLALAAASTLLADDDPTPRKTETMATALQPSG